MSTCYESDKVKIKYLGQCGFILSNDRISIAIDPVLNDIFDDDGNNIRLYPPVMSGKELNVDFLFCSHEHIDHLDIATVKEVAENSPGTRFVIPKGCEKLLLEVGIPLKRIISMMDGETVELPDITVKAVSTAHPVHQVNEAGEDCNLAFALEIDGKCYVHLGDTYLTERLQKSLEALGNIEVIFLPINGMDEIRAQIGIIGNLSTKEAAKLAFDLKSNLSVPMHFDMVKGNTEDPQKFVDALLALDGTMKYWVPEIGVK